MRDTSALLPIALGFALLAGVAHAAPPPLDTVQPQIKAYCARTHATGSPAWTLCVGQSTQGWLDFTKAYPQADPPLMAAYDACQADYAPSGDWALLAFCAYERARASDQLK